MRYKFCYNMRYKQGSEAGMKYVQHVRGKWIVRITVPEELRDIIGARELVEKDLPSDTRKRERIAHGIIDGFLARIDAARDIHENRGNARALPLSAAAKDHYNRILQADQQQRDAMPTMSEMLAEHALLLEKIGRGEIGIGHGEVAMINSTTNYELMLGARDHYANLRKQRLAALRSSFTTGETRWIEDAVRAYVADHRLEVQPHSPEWHDLSKALLRTEIEALERTLERDRGDYGGQPRDPLLTAPDPFPSSQEGPGSRGGITLSEALTAFHNERSAGGSTLAPKTMAEHRNSVRMFNEFMGSDLAVSSITKKNVIDYKQALLKTPNRYTMRFPGLTLPQAIKANAKLKEPFPPLAPKTINMKWLSHLSSILQWASNNGHIETNPAQGIRVDTGSKVHLEPSYLPFTKDELKKIFGDQIFAEPRHYGLNQWALLVMLFTGVRNSSEMARMKLENIYEEQGVPVFFLAEASKNQRSKRLVPIHDDLVKFGFLEYVEGLRRSGEKLLFPEWAERTDKVNDWFNNTYLVNLGLKSRKKVFYSFRHTLATELARAGVPRELSKMISGHAPQEVASVYIHASPITLMAEALNKVKFDLPIFVPHGRSDAIA
ncbi:site-specific integrase [Sinirhodobacter sp. WL0062]|uniref:Site-specific integrase n=1 Tax=Rhodobacter flavimaris TaxID=2907145 RepID=A0ABS8YV99_9RHOB|nr:site-specific integrase [Sinirhodobacter sp. WL0062]MCE5973418.1 site-specific integrase [Sinirhodobacter sp. WL0062]